MALGTGWFKTSGRGGGITDADGRMLTHTTGGMSETQHISNTSSAPGSGATVAAITGLTATGVYLVDGVIALTGTAETALLNLRLRSNGANILGGGIFPTLSAVVVPFTLPRVTVGAGGDLTFITAAAATAGSVYTIRFNATRVE